MKTLKEPKGKGAMTMEGMDRMLPSFSVDEKQLPEIKSWKIGGKYILEIEVEMNGINKNEWRADNPISANLKIVKIGVENKDNEETKQAKKGHY